MFTIILTAAVGLVVTRSAVKHHRANIAIMRQYRPRHILAAIVATAVISATAWGLITASPFFAKNPVLWVVAELFHHGTGDGQANLILSGLQWKWYAVAFLPVLALAVPRFAKQEEIQYRTGTRSWAHGLLKSLRFGLAHMIMLIPIGACLALTWGGLLFTWAYFRGGTDNSTVYHAAFNTVIIVALFVLVLVVS